MFRAPFPALSGHPFALLGLIGVALFAPLPLHAASLFLDLGNGQTVTYPISPNRDVSIAPITGNVTLRPVAAAGVPGDGWCPTASVPAPTMGFTVNPGSVAIGGVATATWTTTNATTCSNTGSTLPGAVANWSASLPTSSPGTSLILNTAGTYTFRLACTGPGGTTAATQTVTATTSTPLPTVNFTVSPSTIAQGGTATAIWSSANATSCSGSGSTLPGAVANWTASLPTSSAGTSLVLNTTGTYTFRLACTGAGGTTAVSRSVTVGTVPAPTVTFTVNPTSVTAGDTTTAVWSTTNATSCSGSGSTLPGAVSNWTSSLPTSNAGLSLSLATVGAYTFRLSCTGGGGTTTVDRSVTVSSSGQPSCTGVPASFGLTRQTTMRNTSFLQGNTEHPNGPLELLDFDVIAGPWPARTQNGTIAVRTGSFVALEFNTGTVDLGTYGPTVPGGTVLNRFGTITTITPSGFAGNVMLSYSACPGQFETASLPGQNSRCRTQSGPGPWSWGVGTNEPFTCNLAPGTRYYLNIAYVDFSTGLNNCSGEPSTGSNPTSCHWFAQPR